MSKFLVFLGLCLLLVSALLAGVVSFAVEDRPRVAREVVVTPDHIERAKRIIDTQRYRVRPGMLAAFRVLPEDADNGANYLARRFGNGSAQITFDDGQARAALSLPLPEGFLAGRYLNLEAAIVATEGLPQFRSVRIGGLAVPDRLVDFLMPQVIGWLRRTPEYAWALDALQLVRISRGGLNVVYRWQGGFPRQVPTSVISEEERDQLRHYHALLAQTSPRGAPAVVPLSEVMRPLFRAAAERSSGSDSVQQHRAAILVLMFYVLGKPLKTLLPEAEAWPRAAYRSVRLDGRDDLAKHFMVSAAIAAYADTALSDAVGLYKEIEDSRTGSGFSFNDIAADRAGTRFGEIAVASTESARRLRQRLSTGLVDSDLMPAWSDLPESMAEAQFKRRFGGIDTPAYRRMMEEIERRVAALPFLQLEK
jgi:hypothetical protein